jgi:hypothetical protein
MPSKNEYRNFLPAHVWRYSISASNCGSTRDADPQPFLSRERKPSESPWLKARMMSKLLFLVRVFRGSMNYSQMKDERLLAFYENVRQQVAMDAGSRYRFAGDGVRAYADKLREEMERRRMRFTPIDWHSGG